MTTFPLTTRVHIRETGAAVRRPSHSRQQLNRNPDTCRRPHAAVYSRIRQALLEAIVTVAVVWGIGYLCILGWNWRMGVM